MKTVAFSDLCNFTPRQQTFAAEVFDPKNKYILYGGAKSGGKSYALRWIGILLLLKWAQEGHHEVRVGLFCESYPQLKDRQMTKMAVEFPEWLGHLGEDRVEGLCFKLNPKYGGGILALRNLDDPSKYNSSEFAGILVDELTMNPESVFFALRGIMRWPGIADVKFLAGTNPIGIGMSWVKRYWISRDFPPNEREGDKFKFVPAKASDNPHLPPDYLDQLAGLSEDMRRAYLEGSWDTYEGQMFPEFKESIHVVAPFAIPAHWRKFRAIDHGRTAPSACVWGAVDELGNVWVYREYYKRGLDADVNARNVVAASVPDEGRYWFTVIDAAVFAKDGGETIAEIYERNGICAEPSAKSRIPGWALIHEFLRSVTPESVYRRDHNLKDFQSLPADVEIKQGMVSHPPKLRIFNTCPELIREIKDGIIEVKKDGPTEDLDSRASDHALDALRYGFQHMHEGRTPKEASWLERMFKADQKKREVTAGNLGKFYANRLR